MTWPVNPRSQLTALAASGATGTSHRDLATQYRVVLTQVWPLIHFMYSFIFYFENHYSFWRKNTLRMTPRRKVFSSSPFSKSLIGSAFFSESCTDPDIASLVASWTARCSGEFVLKNLIEESFEIVASPGSHLDTLPRSGDRFGRGPEVFHWRHCQREREPGHF